MSYTNKELMLQLIRSRGDGFRSLVHWHFMNGIISVICFSLLIAGSVWWLKILFARNKKETEELRSVGIFLLMALAFVFICLAMNGVRDAIDPQGAAINSVLKH